MYARVVTVQFKKGKLDEAKHIIKNFVIPILKKQKGFNSQFLFTQQETLKAISLNLWETEDDLTAFEMSPNYQEVLGMLAPVLAEKPVSEAFEVSVKA